MKLLIALLVCLASTNTFAGETVTGFGDTKAQAAEDTKEKAIVLAQSKGTCYDIVEATDCTKDDDGWTCKSDVADHQGSCGRGKKVYPE